MLHIGYIYVYNTNTNLKYISTIFQRQNETYITDHIHTDMSHPLGLCYAAAYQHPKLWVCTACSTYTAWLGFTLC